MPGLFQPSFGGILETYATGIVYVNGSILAEEAKITIDNNISAEPIITLHNGYAGDSPGTGILEITVESNVKSNGFEFDPLPFMIGSRYVEFTTVIGSLNLNFTGQIYNDNFSHAVNSGSSLVFKARGKIQ